MRLFCVVFTFAFIQIIKGQGLGGEDSNSCNVVPGVDMCNQVGIHSEIICVSPTAFVLPGDNIKHECPNGYVCADVQEICTRLCEPVCPIPIPPTMCNQVGIYSKVICVSPTQFVIPGEDMTFQCPQETVCADVYEICTNSAESACSVSIPPNTNTCTQVGLFSEVGDTTCKRYIACYIQGSGFGQTTYSCPGDAVFDASKQKCVISPSYSC